MKKKLFCLVAAFFVSMCMVAMPEKAQADTPLTVCNPSFDEGAVSGSWSYDFADWKTTGTPCIDNGYYNAAPAGRNQRLV